MFDGYKRKMDSVTADPAFKAELLSKIQSYQPRQKRTVVLPVFKHIAAVAAMLLVVVSIGVFFKGDNSHTAKIVSSDYSKGKVLYIKFDGFEKYDVNLGSQVILMSDELSKEYTLTNLMNELYPRYIGGENSVEINDGMVDSIAGVSVDEGREIKVYVNDREIMNTNCENLYRCFNGSDAYLKVTVTE